MPTIGETTRPGFVYDSATDTWIPVGIGPHSHTPAAIGAISSSLVTTKGDLIVATGSGTVVRQGVGADGSMLVADSSQADGVNYALGNAFAAGKNKFINADFRFWQRGTSFTPGNTIGTHTADRMWVYWDGSGISTFSQQTFAPGTAPVAGYEGTHYMRAVMSSGANFIALAQKIEDVRAFAGQTVTVSFWARATSSVTITPLFRQEFGSGGSALVDTYITPVTLTSSWVRYSSTGPVPSVAGKTIGAGSFLQAYPFVYTSGTVASNTIETWGWQIEAGSVATPFQTATGTIQGELAACQRYYYRAGVDSSSLYGVLGNSGYTDSTTNTNVMFNLPVHMRIAPYAIDYPTLSTTRVLNLGFPFTPTAASLNTVGTTADVGWVSFTSSGMTSSQFSQYTRNNSSTAYIGFSAEL
jgi:hypothetical protein